MRNWEKAWFAQRPPLHALIVKNPNRLRWPPKPIRELAPEQFPQTELDWNDFVPKEEEPSELMDEAVRNLESMRPVDAAPLSMRDFDELRDQLVDGFTYNQLTSYFYRQLRQMGMTRKQLVESLKTEAVRYDWVIEQTKWEASEPDHREKSTPKVDYALMIMQALWKIEVKEQVEGLGRVQLWLQPDVFKLISGPSSSALRTLATQYLYRPNNERIEGSMEESRLDIIARKSIVPVFLARLDEIVSSITSQAVSTEDLNDADLAPGLLQEVARITGSLIEYNEETAELNVTWVANDGLASPQKAGQRDGATYGQTETPAEIALRLLTKQQQKGLPLTLQVISPSQKDTTPPTTYRLMPHQRETRSMSWRERLQSWCRYVSPIGKQPAEDAEPAAPPADGISLPRVSINKTAQPDAAEVLTATFGHILHETPAEQQDGAGAEEAQELAALRNRPRILSPVVPHPAALTPLNIDAAAAEPIAQQTSIVLHFAPSPSQPASAKFQINDSTPSLRLALPIDPDAALSALPLPADATLHAVTPRLAHDVLLPHGVVDVRVAQHAHVALRAADQPLAQLFAACDFDLAEGRLEAPALATFRVPAAWLSTPTGKPSRSKKPVGVRYRFAGLELRQAVEAAWRGHTLVYTSTEAGEHGGQRQELSLRFGPPGHDAAAAGGAPGERERAEFLSLVEGVARGEHFSWHEGFKEVRETAEGDEYIEEPVAEEEEVVVVVEDVVDEVKEAGSAVDEGLDVPFAPETEPAGAVDHEDGGVATQEGGSTAEQPIRSEDESTQALDPAEASPTEDSAPEASSGLEDGLDDAASPALHSRTE
ncbi:hypothetical protein ESCO_003286 [Escovopsis weberi]|uniref:Uncharacterized protein n=1 Tax=Escovopsis weberi TaxID=150374 RepID=A0A0M9VSE5_ESCWE|nr:hypothetical protein ESCO_003286 [Escovopsis weberi]